MFFFRGLARSPLYCQNLSKPHGGNSGSPMKVGARIPAGARQPSHDADRASRKRGVFGAHRRCARHHPRTAQVRSLGCRCGSVPHHRTNVRRRHTAASRKTSATALRRHFRSRNTLRRSCTHSRFDCAKKHIHSYALKVISGWPCGG